MDTDDLTSYSRLFVRGTLVVLALAWLCWIWIPVGWDFFRGLAVHPQTAPPHFVPHQLTLVHYQQLLTGGFLTYVRNSAIVTTTSTVISIVVATLAAYSINRYNPGDGQVMMFILGMRFLPPIAVVIPLYMMFLKFHLIDSWYGLIVAYLTIGIPISTWIMLIFFRRVPVALEEACWIDGWSRLQTLRRVVLPLVAPGIASAAIITAILMWNEYTMALVLTTTNSAQTIPIYLAGFVTTRGILWGQMGAATMIAITPIIVIAFLLQERLVAGFSLEGSDG